MHLRSPLTSLLARMTVAALVAIVGLTTLPQLGTDAPGAGTTSSPGAVELRSAEPNPVTPGDFTGYGFDQCLAPTQQAMNAWLHHSPFLAVGIYISGKSRACRDQPNLTPAWIRTQLAKGWRLLPITLGPQASCSTRFPRYGDDPTINARPGKNGRYGKARRQAWAEGTSAVAEAKRLGIVAGSTLWYDLEAFDLGNRHCRESALAFLSAWTSKLHQLGYKSGVYSSAGSGILMLDNARVQRPASVVLPDMIWVARWDGVANTSTSYIREDGWRPGARVKQYQGGHDEKWGGVRINIDRNYLDVGRGSIAPAETHCGGVDVGPARYDPITPGAPAAQVKALQCLLKERGRYDGKISGVYTKATIAAARSWQTAHRFTASDTFGVPHWIALHMDNADRVLKVGSAGGDVRRLQRALRAAGLWTTRKVTGVYDAATASAVRRYQDRVGLPESGIVNGKTNNRLDRGRR